MIAEVVIVLASFQSKKKISSAIGFLRRSRYIRHLISNFSDYLEFILKSNSYIHSSEFNFFWLESVRVGKYYNWKVSEQRGLEKRSELESVRIGKC